MRCGAFHRVEGTLCLVRHGQAALSGSKTKAPGFAGGYLLALARGDGSREAPAWTAALKREQTAICDRRPWLLYSRLTILAVGAGASPLRTPPPSWLPQCGPIKGL